MLKAFNGSPIHRLIFVSESGKSAVIFKTTAVRTQFTSVGQKKIKASVKKT